MAAVVTAAAVALLTSGSALASASGGGSGAGSVSAPEAPKLRETICLTDCVGLRKAVVGSTVQVSGANMSAAKSISFRSRHGHKRSVAPVTSATLSSAQAVVPGGAGSGPLRVKDAYGQKSDLDEDPLLIRPKRTLRAGGPLHLADAEVSPNKIFYTGSRTATLSYVVVGDQPSNSLRIDVVTGAGQVVQSFFPTAVASNTTQSVAWNGAGLDGKPVPGGWYAFRVSSADGQPLALAKGIKDPGLGVAVFSAIFPVRGPHDFGGPANAFGAARSGHTHQGQDILADCGTKLVAAIGGKVQYAGYQGAAGNYIVIDQKGSPEDNMYAHLITPSPLQTGDHVRTGQWIGNVGQTGDATACHLHFEVWSAPGWYEGGQPYDPLPLLKSWDKYS
jgi:murein DD-endopeptidase MepM/ murein hydrolase activator NlpD